MNVNLPEVRLRTVSATQYVEDLEPPFREKFLEQKQSYKLDEQALNVLRSSGKYVIIAFSAQWCKDCAINIPVLALIAENTGIEIRVFGGIKKDPLSHTRKWRIPPSPRETETFGIEKLPTIIVFDNEGRELGRIIENPRHALTLEQELAEIIKSQR